MRKLIFGLLAIVGIFVAVETKDGIEHELLIRGTGVFVFGLSTYLGGWWDIASEDTRKAKTDNTQNKPLK